MCRFSRLTTRMRQCGMALLVVLWTMAILAIMASSISRSVRQEIRVVGNARSEVHAVSIANAAMQIVARDLFAARVRLSGLQRRTVEFMGQTLEVTVQPLAGLIDLNTANESLLSSVMLHRGEQLPETAQLLARRIVEYRERSPWLGVSGRFFAVDELAAVEGVGYDLYARVRPLLTVDRGAGRGVNLLSADIPVLTVLANGRSDVARRYAELRESGATSLDVSAFPQEFLDSGDSTRVTLKVTVMLPDQSRVEVSRMFDLKPSVARGLPWEAYALRIVRLGLSEGT